MIELRPQTKVKGVSKQHSGGCRDIWMCKELCYLGDTLDGDGGADLVAIARIRNG